MADLSITLRNLLQNLSYHYAMASKQNAANIQSSVSNSTTNSSSSSTTSSTKSTASKTTTTTVTTSSSSTTSSTSVSSSSAGQASTAKASSSLSRLLSSLASVTRAKSTTSALNNTSTITNDMELEFFKSYKNAITTDIYNKISNNLSMTAADLSNFKAQVAKLSADEQKLWKSEISKIEAKIEANIFENTGKSASTGNTSNAGASASPAQNTASQSTTLNGFVSNVLYQNGQKFSGVYSNGLYYQDGVLASGYVNGKVYVDGALLTGTKAGVLYENGTAFCGTKNGLVYNNGILADGVVDGKFYSKGVLASGTFLGKTYVNGILSTGASSSTGTSSTGTSSSGNTGSTGNAGSSAVVRKTTDKNGNVFGYDSNNNLVYLEKTVGGKKYVYTDELNYLTETTYNKLISIDDAIITDRMLSDINIVKNAEAAGLKAGAKGTSAYQKAYDASIKSQMIKTTSNMTNTAGEVVEKNGTLYVNDGKKLVKLNISAETYLELFPPIERYDINQQAKLKDCYFISGCLVDLQKNGTTYAQLLQMFSEDSNGNITIKFAGTLKDYPVTFKNGELKTMDGYVNGSYVSKRTLPNGTKGTQMLEQAYAIANFANIKSRSVESIDIDETMSEMDNGWQFDVYKEVLNMNSSFAYGDPDTVDSYLNSVASKVNDGSMLLSFANYYVNSEYGLTNNHAYSIEKIDTVNKLVYIVNPWYTGETIAIPYSVFAKTAKSDNNKLRLNIGYVNA